MKISSKIGFAMATLLLPLAAETGMAQKSTFMNLNQKSDYYTYEVLDTKIKPDDRIYMSKDDKLVIEENGVNLFGWGGEVVGLDKPVTSYYQLPRGPVDVTSAYGQRLFTIDQKTYPVSLDRAISATRWFVSGSLGKDPEIISPINDTQAVFLLNRKEVAKFPIAPGPRGKAKLSIFADFLWAATLGDQNSLNARIKSYVENFNKADFASYVQGDGYSSLVAQQFAPNYLIDYDPVTMKPRELFSDLKVFSLRENRMVALVLNGRQVSNQLFKGVYSDGLNWIGIWSEGDLLYSMGNKHTQTLLDKTGTMNIDGVPVRLGSSLQFLNGKSFATSTIGLRLVDKEKTYHLFFDGKLTDITSQVKSADPEEKYLINWRVQKPGGPIVLMSNPWGLENNYLADRFLLAERLSFGDGTYIMYFKGQAAYSKTGDAYYFMDYGNSYDSATLIKLKLRGSK